MKKPVVVLLVVIVLAALGGGGTLSQSITALEVPLYGREEVRRGKKRVPV